jgi:glutamyl-tRNA reductase
VVSVALDAAAQRLATLRGRRVLVVGAGSMGALAVSTLAGRGVEDVVVASRTPARAARIAAAASGGRAVGLAELDGELAAADVVVSCTGAQEIVLDAQRLAAVRAAAGRGEEAPLVVLDLALPHDVDPGVGSLPGVTRIDLAALSLLPATAASEADIRASQLIVAEEVAAHAAAVAGQAVEPVLVSLRQHAGGVLDSEMARLRLRLSGIDDAAMAEVERAMRRAMNTLLHTPTVRMKQLAAEPGGNRYAEAIAALFDLDPSIPASVLGDAGHDGPLS